MLDEAISKSFSPFTLLIDDIQKTKKDAAQLNLNHATDKIFLDGKWCTVDPLLDTYATLAIMDVLSLKRAPAVTFVDYAGHEQTAFRFGEHLISRVELCGTVLAYSERERYYSIRIDDETGSIDCTLWRSEQSTKNGVENAASALARNTPTLTTKQAAVGQLLSHFQRLNSEAGRSGDEITVDCGQVVFVRGSLRLFRGEISISSSFYNWRSIVNQREADLLISSHSEACTFLRQHCYLKPIDLPPEVRAALSDQNRRCFAEAQSSLLHQLLHLINKQRVMRTTIRRFAAVSMVRKFFCSADSTAHKQVAMLRQRNSAIASQCEEGEAVCSRCCNQLHDVIEPLFDGLAKRGFCYVIADAALLEEETFLTAAESTSPAAKMRKMETEKRDAAQELCKVFVFVEHDFELTNRIDEILQSENGERRRDTDTLRACFAYITAASEKRYGAAAKLDAPKRFSEVFRRALDRLVRESRVVATSLYSHAALRFRLDTGPIATAETGENNPSIDLELSLPLGNVQL